MKPVGELLRQQAPKPGFVRGGNDSPECETAPTPQDVPDTLTLSNSKRPSWLKRKK